MIQYVLVKRCTVWRVLLSCLVMAVCLLVVFHPTQAYADTKKNVVSEHPVSISKGEVAEDVVVIGNNATISGTVADTLVVINGNVQLTSTGRAGIVIDLGGQVTQEPGARVNAVYALAFSEPLLNSITVGSALVVAVWAVRAAISAALVAFPVLIVLVFRARLEQPIAYLERSVRRMGLTGVFASLMFLALSGITAITIILLPVTAILSLLYAAIGLVGFTCVSLWLGRMNNIVGAKERPMWLQTLIGATFAVAFINIPLVGPLLLIIAWLVGIGSVTTWGWQRWQSRKGKTHVSET